MNTLDTGQYLDLGGLAGLRYDAKQSPSDADTLRKVAEQFESMFVHMVLKSQREASFGDPLFDSHALDTLRDLQDQQLSMELARGGGVGLADMLVQQLEKYVDGVGDAEAVTGTGIPVDLPSENRDADLVDLENTRERVLTQAGEGRTEFPLRFDLAEQRLHVSEFVGVAVAPSGTQAVASPVAPMEVVTPTLQVQSQWLKTPDADTSSARAPQMAEAETTQGWQSPEEFVQSLMPSAREAASALGVDPRVLVAQAALETGWGKHVPHDDSTAGYNLFGIKADSRWDGERVSWNTLEHDGHAFKPVRAQFRAYDGVEHALQDYVDFIRSNPRYQDAVTLVDDARAYVYALQDAGYATDPHYADKILQILHGERLNSAVASLQG